MGISVAHPSEHTFVKHLDTVTEKVGQLTSWLTLFMMVTMTLVVVLRYGFNLGWIWLQESVLYMHAMVFMLAMAYALKHDEHVRVDIFYRKKSQRFRNRVNLFGHIFFLLPTSLFILFMSWSYVAQSWSVLEGSQEAGGLAFVYILKSLLVIMPLLLIFQGISEIIKLVLSNKKEQK